MKSVCGQSPPPLLLKTDMLENGLPGGTSGEELAYHHRRHERRGFDPWVRKIPGGGNGSHSSILPGKPHGRRSLLSYSPWSHKSQTRLDKFSMHAQLRTIFKDGCALGLYGNRSSWGPTTSEPFPQQQRREADGHRWAISRQARSSAQAPAAQVTAASPPQGACWGPRSAGVVSSHPHVPQHWPSRWKTQDSVPGQAGGHLHKQ